MAKSKRLTKENREDYEKRSGLDILKQFIPVDDYTDALIESVSRNTEPLDDNDRRSPDREQMIKRSVAILSYLRDNGYNFSVQSDRNEGQMIAKIEDTDISIRLLDTDQNARYVGRVYNDGVSFYLSAGRSGNKETSEELLNNITPEMAVDIVRYALGERVNRVDRRSGKSVPLNDAVGTPDLGTDGRKNAHTYLRADGMSFLTMYSKEAGSDFDALYIRCQNEKNVSTSVHFVGEDAAVNAEEFIRSNYEAAMQNFTEKLKLEAVDMLARMKARNEYESAPEFSDDKAIADIQMDYFNKRLAVYTDNENYPDNASKMAVFAEQDRDVNKQVAALFGDIDNKSINLVNIAKYMGVDNMLSNEDSLLNAVKASKKAGHNYTIEGNSFIENGFREKSILYTDTPVFDDNGDQIYPKDINPSSRDFTKLSPFWQQIGNTIKDGLNETGVVVDSIHLDENGIVHYEGSRRRKQSISDKNPPDKIIGNLGQIFEPDTREFNSDGSVNLKHGLIRTKFDSDSNYYIAPGYTAYVVPPSADNPDESFEARTRLRGYMQEMTSAIRATLRHDIVSNGNYDNTAGLNSVYHHLYGDKLSLDFEEQMKQEGKDVDMIKAINETALRRVRYDNCYKDGTSILSKVRIDSGLSKQGYDLYRDNVKSNMAVIDEHSSAGYFDLTNTGTGTNQGIVRYLVEDAVVNPDGSIAKGESLKSPLVAHEDFRFSHHNPPDRNIMSMMNAMNQSSTARGRELGDNGEKIGVGTAHMSLGGYTQDDAFVISGEFAKNNLIRGKDGNMRPLQVGDKICDHSGNKGVISFIADRDADMSYYEPTLVTNAMTDEMKVIIEKENKTRAMQKRIIDLFKENPTLDVVGAPYTAPSRFNGGTAREMIESQEKAKAAGITTDLVVEGEVHKGSIGYISWIITDMPVDEKTHLYEHDGEGGRKASGQMVWALSELGADAIIDEIYKYNNEPTIKTRELMIATGLDLSETGEIRKGYQPHLIGYDDYSEPIYEQRKEFSIQDVFNEHRDEAGRPHTKNFNNAFGTLMGEDGGFMLVPFPITLASGEVIPEKLDKDGNSTGEYMFPILAGKYRSGRETVDNNLVIHEYTAQYKAIYEAAGTYLRNKELLASAKNGMVETVIRTTGATRYTPVAEIEQRMADAKDAAQRAYNKMADSIIERHFEGKHNIFKDEVMRKQLQNTATAVITPDPSLDLNEIGLTATTAIALGINVDEYDAVKGERLEVFIWRDPLLSGGGIRGTYVRITENRPGYPGYDSRNPLNNQVGMAINPSIATSFEGDFDGDSMGLYLPHTEAARKCLHEKLSMEAQLLNREAGERGHHNMYFQDGLDVAAGAYYDELNGGSIKERMAKATALANEADLTVNGDATKNEEAYKLFNEAMHDAQNAAFGHDVINYGSAEEHFESLIPMIKSGAKGSAKKLVEGYAPYFGAKLSIDENFEIHDFVDVGEPYVTEIQRSASFAATHAKAYLTGVAGKFSQHAEMMALNTKGVNGMLSCSAAATALTHPVTQSVMQLKHDTSDEISHKIDMIQTVAPALWAGQKIEKCTDRFGKPSWKVVQERDAFGKFVPVQATPEQWKKMFMAFYTDKHGLNVPMPNPEYIGIMANILTTGDGMGGKCIKGFDTKTKAVLEAEQPLTRMAYECTFNTLKDYADKTESGYSSNLFSGPISGLIAPKTVRDNIAESIKANKDPEYQPRYKGLMAKDTQCKDVIPAPSVDVIDKYIKEGAMPKQPVVEEEETIKTTRSYADLKPDERKNLFRSIGRKAVALMNGKSVSLTPIEKEAYNLAKTQRSRKNEFESEDAYKVYVSKHPEEFSEKMLYDSYLQIAKDERATFLAEQQAKEEARKSVNKSNGGFTQATTSEQMKLTKELYGIPDTPAEEDTSKFSGNAYDYATNAITKAFFERQLSDNHLDKLSDEEYNNVAKTVVTKYIDRKGSEPIEFDDVCEREFNDYLVQQNEALRWFNETERKDFVEKHIGDFKERIVCSRIRSEIEMSRGLKPYDKLSDEQFNAVAETVVIKYLNRNGKSLAFDTDYEREFNKRLVAQNEKLKRFNDAEKSEYVKAHPDEFRERITCTDLRSKFGRNGKVKDNQNSNNCSNNGQGDGNEGLS